MNKQSYLFVAAGILLSFSFGARAVVAQAPAKNGAAAALAKNVGDLTAQEEDEFAKAAEATLERVCVACHPFENIMKNRRTLPEWDAQVAQMAMRGAPGTETDFALVKKYMTRYYGIVHVNTAPAEELSAVLGLPSKVAAALVEYRKTNGKFTDLASLTKVDGVDKAKLQENADALRFD